MGLSAPLPVRLPRPWPEDFDLDAYANRSFGIYQDSVEEVVLRVLPHRAEDALGWCFHPAETLEPQPDSSVLVRFRASGRLDLARCLFSWGDKLEILALSAQRTRSSVATGSGGA